MESARPGSFSDIIDEVPFSEKSLLLVNRTKPEPLVDLLKRAFDSQPVTITDRQVPEGPENVVCLVEDGTVTETSRLSALEAAYLQVNVDRYRTGTRQGAAESFPDVLTGLDEVEFTVRGFPESAKEKLLLAVISRFIERQALVCDDGELHSSFQWLSRLDDEHGTHSVYEWLADSGVDTHVYGVRDDPTVVESLDVTVHAGATPEHRRSWVVAFSAPEEAATDSVALVAQKTGKSRWRGVWTYDPARVTRVQSYMRRQF